MTRITSWRWTMLVAFIALVAACATDVTLSPEYLDLEKSATETDRELKEARAELTDLTARLTHAEAGLEEATVGLQAAEVELARGEGRIEDLEAARDAANARADRAEADLEEELNRPWPEEVKAAFVNGCVATPNEGLSDAAERDLCTCMIDEVGKVMPLIDYLVFEVVTFGDPDVAIDPTTGYPAAVDADAVAVIAGAAARCYLVES